MLSPICCLNEIKTVLRVSDGNQVPYWVSSHTPLEGFTPALVMETLLLYGYRKLAEPLVALIVAVGQLKFWKLLPREGEAGTATPNGPVVPWVLSGVVARKLVTVAVFAAKAFGVPLVQSEAAKEQGSDIAPRRMS